MESPNCQRATLRLRWSSSTAAGDWISAPAPGCAGVTFLCGAGTARVKTGELAGETGQKGAGWKRDHLVWNAAPSFLEQCPPGNRQSNIQEATWLLYARIGAVQRVVGRPNVKRCRQHSQPGWVGNFCNWIRRSHLANQETPGRDQGCLGSRRQHPTIVPNRNRRIEPYAR